MQRYIVRRFLLFVPTMLIASLVVFAIMRMLPGDVALLILGGDDTNASFYKEDVEGLRTQLGLNDPLPVQYGKWLWSMVSGDFGGQSLTTKEPVREIVARRLPVTLQLVLYTFAIALTVSVPLGVIAALHQDRWPDYLVRVLTITGLAMPNFWLALLLILGLVLYFNWSPPLVYVNLWEDPRTHLEMAIWPALVLAWQLSSYIARITRSSMLEVLRQDYVRTAYSKGLRSGTVIWRHALRNSLIPVTTLTGAYLGGLLGGTVILEAIFGLPGMGQGVIQAATSRDYPVIQSLVMVLVFLTLVLNLIVDLLYVLIDPRISYG